MNLLPLQYFGNKILLQKAAPVTDFNAQLRAMVKEMFFAMYEHKGIGLAAPQIGVSQRIFVMEVTPYDKGMHTPKAFINPQIAKTSGSCVIEEGCLSFPDLHVDIKRPAIVSGTAYNEHGQIFEFEFDELLARIVLHENDHLNGVLFIEYLSFVKRNMLSKQLNQIKNMPRS